MTNHKLPTASYLPMGALCRRSFIRDGEEALPNESGEAARLGSAVHAVMAGVGPCSSIAKSYGVNEDAVAMAASALREREAEQIALTTEVNGCFAEMMNSRRAEISTDAGTLDVLYRGGDASVVFDYKTGHGDVAEADENLQLAAYAIAAYDIEPTNKVIVSIIKPHGKPMEPAVYTAEDIEAIRPVIQNLREEMVSDRAGYSPGEHCRYCRRRPFCPAIAPKVNTCLEIAGKREFNLVEMADHDIASLDDMIKVAESDLGALKWATRREIDVRGGVVCSDGSRLMNRPQKTRSIDPVIGFPVFGEYLGDRMVEAINLSPGAAEKVLSEITKDAYDGKPPRGALSQVKKAFNDALYNNGAVSYKERPNYTKKKDTQDEQ